MPSFVLRTTNDGCNANAGVFRNCIQVVMDLCSMRERAGVGFSERDVESHCMVALLSVACICLLALAYLDGQLTRRSEDERLQTARGVPHRLCCVTLSSHFLFLDPYLPLFCK